MNDLDPMWRAELCDAAIMHGQMGRPVWPPGSRSSPLHTGCENGVSTSPESRQPLSDHKLGARRFATMRTLQFRYRTLTDVEREWLSAPPVRNIYADAGRSCGSSSPPMIDAPPST